MNTELTRTSQHVESCEHAHDHQSSSVAEAGRDGLRPDSLPSGGTKVALIESLFHDTAAPEVISDLVLSRIVFCFYNDDRII